MADSAPEFVRVDRRGVSHTTAQHVGGFPVLLWEVLSEFGYDTLPVYVGEELAFPARTRFQVFVRLPRHPTRPELAVAPVRVVSYSLESCYQHAAFSVLRDFCALHREELEGTLAALVPLEEHSRHVWQERVAPLLDTQQPGHSPQLARALRLSEASFLLTSQLSQERFLTDLDIEDRQDEVVRVHEDVEAERETTRQLTARVAELETELVEVDGQRQQAVTDRRGLQFRVTEYEEQVVDLEMRLANMTLERDQYREAAADLGTRYQTVSAQLVATRAAGDGLVHLLQEQDDQIGGLFHEVHGLHHQLEHLQQQLQEAQHPAPDQEVDQAVSGLESPVSSRGRIAVPPPEVAVDAPLAPEVVAAQQALITEQHERLLAFGVHVARDVVALTLSGLTAHGRFP